MLVNFAPRPIQTFCKLHQPSSSSAAALQSNYRYTYFTRPGALHPVRSFASDDDTGSAGDMDSLARMLSQQAAKLRASIGDDELRKSYDGFDDVPRSGVFGLQVRSPTLFQVTRPQRLAWDVFAILFIPDPWATQLPLVYFFR